MTEMTRPARWQVMAAFAAVYFIWGSTYIAIRIGVQTLPPFLMGGIRFLLAGSLLYGLSRAQGAPAPTRVHWRSALLLGALLLMAGNGGVTWAEQKLPSSIAALLVAMVPLWMVLLDWWRPGGVRPNWQVFAGLALGTAGIILLVGPGEMTGQVDLLAAGVLVFTTFSWAVGSLLSRRMPLPSSLLLSTGMQMLMGGVLLTTLGTATGEWARLETSHVSLDSVLALGYLIVFGAIVAYTAYVWLLRVVPAARVSTYAYVNPAVAIFLGWALFHEPLEPRTLVAAAIIIAAVVIITTFRARTGAPNRIRFQPVPDGAASTSGQVKV